MINSYENLERDYMFEKWTSIQEQHRKILEECIEVDNEIRISSVDNSVPQFNNSIGEYIHEVLDLMMACNNQLLRLENRFGEHFMKSTMAEWDCKMEEYKNNKYSVTP